MTDFAQPTPWSLTGFTSLLHRPVALRDQPQPECHPLPGQDAGQGTKDRSLSSRRAEGASIPRPGLVGYSRQGTDTLTDAPLPCEDSETSRENKRATTKKTMTYRLTRSALFSELHLLTSLFFRLPPIMQAVPGDAGGQRVTSGLFLRLQ